jgi:hypothetical protein
MPRAASLQLVFPLKPLSHTSVLPLPVPPSRTMQHIDVFDVTRGFVRITRCSGHSSAVRMIDWAADSSAIASVCQAYEVGG